MKGKLRMSPYRRAREELLSGNVATRIQALADLEAAIRADQRRIDAEKPKTVPGFPLPIRPDGSHHYVSTSCACVGSDLMADGRPGHEYCRATTCYQGAKRGGLAKCCGAPCQCACHQEQPDIAEAGNAECGFVRDRWDGPYQMRDRCTGQAGHAAAWTAEGHGPWVMLADAPASVASPATDDECECGHYRTSHRGTGRFNSICHLCAVQGVMDAHHVFAPAPTQAAGGGQQ